MKIKIFLYFILFFNFMINCDQNCDQNKVKITGKSFFSIQPIFRPTSPECVSINRDQLNIYNDKKATIDITVFGGQSTNSNKLAEYFLPFGNNTILNGELGSNAVKKENVDAIANYFGILTSKAPSPGDSVKVLNNYTFESKVSFKPKHKFAGIVFTYKQHISRYTDKGLWFELVIPFEYVKNSLNLHEKIITAGGPKGNDPAVPKGFVANMTQAFKQKLWRFGKIDCAQSKFGIADAYFKFGYIYMKEQTHHLNSYVGMSLPTGNVPTDEFVFEPIVGNNGHLTLFLGNSAGFRIWSKCEKSINFEFDILGTIYASNHQTRSIDLKDKTWSRYMWVYLDSKSTTTHPGINAFSKRVEVSPGTTRDINSAFIYRDCAFQAEVGYHFFSRQAEQVKLARDWIKGPAIASIIKNDEIIAGHISRNNATINEYLRIKNDSIDSTEVYKIITENDLDLNSASHPTTISHTGYLSLSYNCENTDHPKFFGAGGSYEFSSDNSAISRWMIWARFGISF